MWAERDTTWLLRLLLLVCIRSGPICLRVSCPRRLSVHHQTFNDWRHTWQWVPPALVPRHNSRWLTLSTLSLVQPGQVQATGPHCSAFPGKRPLLQQKPRIITLLSLSACRESWVLKFIAPSICTVLCLLRITNPSVLSGRHDLSSLYRWTHCQKGGWGEWGITFS